MAFSGQQIRILRQRLGWSLAEMARQMGCSTELISRWENDSEKPDHDAVNQLRYLNFYIETYAEQIHQLPVAEKEIESRKVAQLTYRELLKDGN